MTSIPHELVEAIVDELQTDRDTLKSCALVSSAFCTPSQRHLFRSLILHRKKRKHYNAAQLALPSGVTAGTIKGAFSLLSESPHLAAYVRDLTIDLPEPADRPSEDRPLANVLRSAENLERFVFCGFAGHREATPAPLWEALLEVIARPSLRGLHFLQLYQIPLAVVDRALESVRVLSFHNTSASTSSEEGNEDSDDAAERQDENRLASGRTSLLEELILSRNMPSIHSRILSPHTPPLTKLRKLCVWSIDSASDRLLRSSAGTLRHLEIDCEVLRSPLHASLPALSSLKSLQSLKLYMFWGLNHRLPDGFAQTLADLPVISSLHLVFSVYDSIAYDSTAPNVWIHEVGPLPGFPPHPHTHTEVGYHNARGKITMQCQLVFIGPPHKGSDRDGLFSSFCEGIRLAFPGLEVEFERADGQMSYLRDCRYR